MSFLELLLIGVGLSMDAFAVAICQGLCMPKLNWRYTTGDCHLLWRFSGIDAFFWLGIRFSVCRLHSEH